MQKLRKVSRGWWLALVLAAGYFPVHMAVGVFVGSWLDAWFGQTVAAEHIEIRRSGEVVIVRYPDRTYASVPKHYSLTGEEVPRSGEDAQGKFDANQLRASQTSVPSLRRDLDSEDGPPERLSRLQRVVEGASWFARRDDANPDRGYLEGYHIATRRRVGFLSAAGYSTTRPPAAHQWPLPAQEPVLQNVFLDTQHAYQSYEAMTAADGTVLRDQPLPTHLTFLAAQDGIWEVDLRAKRTRRILEVEHILTLRRITAPAPLEGAASKPSVESLLLRTPDTLIVFDPVSQTRRDYSLPQGSGEFELGVAAVNDGGLVLSQRLGNVYRYDLAHMRLWWLDKTGREVRTFDTPGQPASDRIIDRPWVSGLAVAAIGPTPLIPTIGWIYHQHRAAQLSPADRERLVNPSEGPMLGWMLAGTLAISAGLALRATALARQYGGAVPWQWGVFVLLLGLPGYVGLVYARRRPLLTQCEWLRGEALVVPPRLTTDVVAA